jgi:hypothetical protein
MRLHMMTDDEYAVRRQQQYDARKHWVNSKRVAQSKRTVKGHSKGFNAALKNSKVYSMGMEVLRWSPHTYKALNNGFNLNQAS